MENCDPKENPGCYPYICHRTGHQIKDMVIYFLIVTPSVCKSIFKTTVLVKTTVVLFQLERQATFQGRPWERLGEASFGSIHLQALNCMRFFSLCLILYNGYFKTGALYQCNFCLQHLWPQEHHLPTTQPSPGGWETNTETGLSVGTCLAEHIGIHKCGPTALTFDTAPAPQDMGNWHDDNVLSP